MPDILIQAPDKGLNCLLEKSMLDPRNAAWGTQNILYEYGILRTPEGFAKLDLAGTGLNSGDKVLSLFQWSEYDAYSHLMAVTTEKIYEHDPGNSTWSDRTQSGLTMASAIEFPISFAVVGHNDSDIYLNDNVLGAHSYYHLIVCDGGKSDIQRWAGRYETDLANLLGGGGYHDGVTHRALQVAMTSRNRLLLVSPKEYNSGSAVWIENKQRIRWPAIGKLEDWASTDTGSGFIDLQDTRGVNVWSALLGDQQIIYQTRGIWNLNYVGGSSIFEPYPAIPDLGLLSYQLLAVRNNVHYFVGTDYNIYAYYGGSVIQPIGDQIHKFLKEDIETDYEYNCRMVISARAKFLYLFIVPSGGTYATKAYVYNLSSGSWTIRDYSNKFTAGGITAVTLAGTEQYTIGDTYQDALDTDSDYISDESQDIAITDYTSQKYGDALYEFTTQLIDWTVLDEYLDFTNIDFTKGGIAFCVTVQGAGSDISNSISVGDILLIKDGSGSTNIRYGAHYYAITCVSTDVTSGIKMGTIELAPRDTTACAVADASNDTPVINNGASADTSGCIFDASGETYREKINTIMREERVILGDSAGFVYEVSEGLYNDDGTDISARHLTPVLDLQQSNTFKRWPGIVVAAEGTIGGSMYVGYRTASFDTSDTGWTDQSFDLTNQWLQKTFYVNKSSKEIQFRFKDFTGNYFKVKEFWILEPEIEENR